MKDEGGGDQSTPVRLYSDREILAVRPAKNAVDFTRPNAFLVEPECSAANAVEGVATVFLTNRECPFRCLMCDLWRNTTDERIPLGAIPQQIDYALSRLPPAQHIKLYNSGNFFDPQAIPVDDYQAIAEQVNAFQTAIVESHPRLCGERCLRFRDLLQTQLEVAIGLETIHPQVLESLNKQMTLDDFQRAVEFLLENHIAVRAFVLLKPPFLDEEDGIDWAIRSVEYAFSVGVGCCAVIPTRTGNGIMERLENDGSFAPPRLASLERTLQCGIEMQRGRVFVDLWDVEKFFDCARCGRSRAERLRQMNFSQRVLPAIICDCGTEP